MRNETTILPRELARLHASGYGFEGEWALAPWAIDDATDVLYETRTRAKDLFWMAASSLSALYWGLHDWVHFHNHGPFEEPAMTELACDIVALSWMRMNRETLGLDASDVQRVAREVGALGKRRFEEERKTAPVDVDHALLSAISG